MGLPAGTERQLGRYELKRLIGRGGMAEVYEAESVGEGGFRRRVAVKRLIAAEVADVAMRRMFLDEARICSALHHACIVSVVDFGVVDDAPFQVMEFVDGLSSFDARQRLAARGSAFPEHVALHICRSVAYALAYAHEVSDAEGPLQIVHRDVKPANILLSWEGDVKLADFGIALGRTRAERTEAGQVKGTLNYMAPEQLAGLGVDGRADVFALGCVLHALITGKSPLADMGSSIPLLRGDELVVDEALSADVAAIVKKAMRATPAERFATAREMATALDDAVAERTARDPRGELVSLLGGLRREAPAPRGKLDDLLGLAFVPSDMSAREYHSTKTTVDAPLAAEPRLDDAARSGAKPLVVDAPTVAEPRLDDAGRSAAERPVPHGMSPGAGTAANAAERREDGVGTQPRRWGVASFALVALVLGVASAIAAVLVTSPRTGRTSDDVLAPTTPSSLSSSPSRLPRSPVDSPPGSASPPAMPLAVVSASSSASVSPPPLRAPAPRSRGPAGAPLPSAAAVANVGTEESGFVAFRALPGATRTTILVDGTPRGFAPRVLALPLGSRQISFIDAEGITFGRTTIAVRPEFSRASPKVIDVPASAR